jgi:hypothetical protein
MMKPCLNVILMALFLAGCAATPAPVVMTKTVYQPFVWPAYLKTCQADPPEFPIPHIEATDPKAGSQVARYILGLRNDDADARNVADDCRNTLAAALAADMMEPPK